MHIIIISLDDASVAPAHKTSRKMNVFDSLTFYLVIFSFILLAHAHSV